MISSIATLPYNVKSIHRLRLNPPDGIAVLFDMFVDNGAFPLDDEKQHFRWPSFLLASNTIIQLVAVTMNRLLRSVKVPIRHNRLVIDLHPIIVCSATKCIDETTQSTLWARKFSLIIKY
jgi:hypothetical protein